MKKIKGLFYLLTGFSLWVILVIFRGLYKGDIIFYKLVQSEKKGLFNKIAREFASGPLARIFVDYRYYIKNKDNTRVSEGILAGYGDESMAGYGDDDYGKNYGGDTIFEQQRGVIIPLIESYIEYSGGKGSLIEIGMGNGDIIAHFAEKHPGIKCIGVDFFVQNARKKFEKINNLEFVDGYALDLLEMHELKGDCVFASSTICKFNPKELEIYLDQFQRNGIKNIIISEPSWAGYPHENNDKVESYHIESQVWFHNYCGYFRKANYDIKEFKFFPYKHPKSNRIDIDMSLVWACKN